jgi:hypothetical protein
LLLLALKRKERILSKSKRLHEMEEIKEEMESEKEEMATHLTANHLASSDHLKDQSRRSPRK